MKSINTYVLISILTGLSACSGSNALPEPDGLSTAITYAVGIASRADTIYTHKSQIPDFYVKALAADGQPYILCDHITRQPDGSLAEADGFTRYWPAEGTQIGFFAAKGVMPDSMQWADDKSGVIIPRFTVRSQIPDQTDLLVANTGPLSSPSGNAPSASVPLTFNHALCQIVLRARNIDPAIDVEINGIGLKHIQNFGTLKADLSTPSHFEWELATIDDQKKPTYKLSFGTNIIALHGRVDADYTTLVNGTDTVGSTMMMIPQTLVAFAPETRPHGASLMIHANIWNVADDSGIHAPDDKKVWGDVSSEVGEWMMIPLDEIWLPGRRYVYTITFGSEGTNGGYEEDEDNPDKDRVFDPITFHVDIEPWKDGGDIIQNIY